MKVMDILALFLEGAIMLLITLIPFIIFGIGIAIAIMIVWAILKVFGVIAMGVLL